MQPHRLTPVEANGGGMLPGAGRIPTGPHYMTTVAHTSTGGPIRSTPSSMEDAHPGAPAATHGEYRTLHKRLRVGVDAGSRPVAWRCLCVGCRKKRAKQPPTVQNFPRPITPEEVDSESDDDDMEDDEERPEDGDTTQSKTSQNQGEGACGAGEVGVVAAEPRVEPGPVAATGAGVGHRDGAEERPGAMQGGS